MRFTLSSTDRSSLAISTAFVLSALLPLVFADVAQAESVRTHQCERSDVVRIVELQADNDSGVPCRVLYHKPTENQPTVNLWNAQNDALFCQTNYDVFIEKLEDKLNWSCSLADSSPYTSATDAQESDDALAIEPVETSEATPTTKFQIKPTPLNPIDSPVEKPRPSIAAALPDAPDATDALRSDATLSMDHIKTFIPSGTYTAVSGDSQTENPSACPSSGFFIWNTKLRENPVFEMGPNHAFRFALAPTSALPTAAHISNGNKPARCDIPVSTGYCEQEQYVGATPLHPALRSYFACDDRSDKPTIQRPLVLASTFATSDENGQACEISETSRYMAIAPSQTVSGDILGNSKHDLELILLAKNAQGNSLKQGRGAVCRYIRGGLR